MKGELCSSWLLCDELFAGQRDGVVNEEDMSVCVLEGFAGSSFVSDGDREGVNKGTWLELVCLEGSVVLLSGDGVCSKAVATSGSAPTSEASWSRWPEDVQSSVIS